MFGEMREKEKVSSDLQQLDAAYRRYKAAGKKSSLLLAAFRPFLRNILFQFLGGITAALLNFLSPFLMIKLVKFIEEGSTKDTLDWETVKPGVILSGLLIGSQFLS